MDDKQSRGTMISEDVRIEKVRTLYRQTAPVLFTNVVNGAIVCATLWSRGPRLELSLWLTALVVLSTARALLWRSFRQRLSNRCDLTPWGRRFTVGAATAGALWGGAGFLFLERQDTLAQLLVTFVIGGMCAAAAGTLACYLPAFRAFLLPALVPLALRMVLFGTPTHLVMATMIVIYGFALSTVARTNHRVLTEAFTLRFENQQLLEELTVARSHLEETNRTLEQRVQERTDALRIQTELLRDAQRMEAVGRLAGGVAHDFNNLLTIILANLHELNQQQSRAGRSSTLIREMTEAARRGADLVRQLLLFSRRQHTHPEVLDLNAVVRGMEQVLNRLLGERLVLRLSLDQGALPVHVDPTQIEQVIINLITNARDASNGDGLVTVETYRTNLRDNTDGIEAGTYVVLGITDNGSGMDAETRQFIFDPFFTTKDVGKGTGLGLATVYGIVSQCHGHIRVRSAVNHGSTFRIFLPVACETTHLVPTSLVMPKVSSARPSLPDWLRGLTVLLVEDDTTVRNVTHRILVAEGFRVHTAESGERALELAAELEQRIDLLITDVVMAGIGGVTLSAQLRATRPDLATLFVSGYSRNQEIPADDPARGLMFLAKPFTRDALVSRLTELLTTWNRAEAVQSQQTVPTVAGKS